MNKCIINSVFPDELKLAKIISIYEKGNILNTEKSRPASLLSHFYNIFERIGFRQISSFMSPNFQKSKPVFDKIVKRN